MNERIKELAKKVDPKLARETIYCTSNDLEKFAELIVLECARVATSVPCPYTDKLMIQQLGHTWDMACVESGRAVKKAFRS